MPSWVTVCTAWVQIVGMWYGHAEWVRQDQLNLVVVPQQARSRHNHDVSHLQSACPVQHWLSSAVHASPICPQPCLPGQLGRCSADPPLKEPPPRVNGTHLPSLKSEGRTADIPEGFLFETADVDQSSASRTSPGETHCVPGDVPMMELVMGYIASHCSLS